MFSRRFLRIKALKSLYSHYTIKDESLIETRNKMIHSVNKSYDLYFMLINLIIEVQDHAAKVSEINRAKHLATEEDINPNLKFVSNKFVNLVRENQDVKDFCKKNSLCWGDNKELFKQLYNSMISREYFKKYMASDDCSFEADRDMVLKFYKKEIEDNDYLFSIIEDFSLYWIDEVEFVCSKVISTFVKWSEQEQEILTQFSDKIDEEYVRELIIYTISNFDKSIEIIKKYSKNWDSDRVTIMDKILISMAYSEFVDFPSIPINVSLDEYIEISKYYSTTNSSVYINGLLDKVLTELRREDKIVKVGRGLE